MALVAFKGLWWPAVAHQCITAHGLLLPMWWHPTCQRPEPRHHPDHVAIHSSGLVAEDNRGDGCSCVRAHACTGPMLTQLGFWGNLCISGDMCAQLGCRLTALVECMHS